MKKKGLILSFVFLINLCLSAQLKWLNPTPSGYINKKITFVNDSTGYLMNTNGDLFVTRDTGSNWQLVRNFLNARTFQLSNTTGVIPANDSALYISTDNGVTWVKRNNSPGSLADWTDIVGRDTIFILKNTATSYINVLYRSVDRGNSWQLINNNIDQFKLNTIDFVTSLIGYAARTDGIYKTSDGGISWQKVYNISTSSTVITMKFFNTQFGYANREFNDMLKTTDGGATWTASNFPDRAYDIFIINANNAYAAGEDGIVYRTTNGGTNWTWASPSGRISNYDLYSLYFFNDTAGIITGHRGRLLKTTNGGSSWTQHSPTYIDVTTVSFGNDSIGYATTWQNVYKTNNGGKTWNRLTLDIGPPPFEFDRFEHSYFWSKDSGFVTANQVPRLYKTADGGQSWVTIYPGNPFQFDYMPGFSFINRDTGYISLQDYASTTGLFKTTNGGSSWQQIGNHQNFWLLHFLNDRVGYASWYNKLYKTIDGGNSWTELIIPTNNGLKDLCFINQTKGFIAADQGYLKMTLDGGNTWVNIYMPPNPFNYPDLVSIKFYDANIGYLTDDEGRFYKTINGGFNWKQSGSTSYYQCSSILFRPDSTVMLAGIFGTIVSTDIPECRIDSVDAVSSACGATFKAVITASISIADSIYFEYGKGGFTQRILANPSKVTDSTIRMSMTVNNLTADSIYKMRVKVLHRGMYRYSDEIFFIPLKSAPPMITAAGNILSSSYLSGNQWYLNGTLVPGATNQQYTVTSSGTYTVIAALNGCPSVVSAGFTVTITATTNINQLSRDIRIYPNPVFSNEIAIIVNNNHHAVLVITDFQGRSIRTTTLNNGNNRLLIPELSSGIYIFSITDIKTHESVYIKLVKI